MIIACTERAKPGIGPAVHVVLGLLGSELSLIFLSRGLKKTSLVYGNAEAKTVQSEFSWFL